ncbi:MAG: S41 family peptidase [Bacteroidota bacterium]
MASKITLFAVFFLLSVNVFASDCDCSKHYQWVKTTFEQNDAGFTYAIQKKGKDSYQQHNQKIANKVEHIEEQEECIQALNEWLAFFRTGQHEVVEINYLRNNPYQKQVDEAVELPLNLSSFKKHLRQKESLDFEGIWEDRYGNQIAVKEMGGDFVAITTKPKRRFLKKGKVNFRLKITENGDTLATHVLSSHQKINSLEKLTNNYFLIGNSRLYERVYPKPSDKENLNDFKKTFSTQPYLEKINDNTVYLKIQGINPTFVQPIEELIAANQNLLQNTENLIIDIRNSRDGNDSAYNKIYPYLYTNPITIIPNEYFSTELNNLNLLHLENSPYHFYYSETEKEKAKKTVERLEKRRGEFVNLYGKDTLKIQLEPIQNKLKNVAILINQENRGGNEQFLLNAKQSSKVTLFGTATMGALDFSNMTHVRSPCGNLKLGYATTKSLRLPENPIDETGILPDVNLENVPQHRWVDFAVDYFNKK